MAAGGGKRGPRVPARAPDDPSSGLTIRQLLAKARTATGAAVSEQAAITDIESTLQRFSQVGAVEPPYDPESLLNYVELSAHLEPSIEAYAQNIDGYGYQAVPLAPWMDALDSPEAREAVSDALQIERWVQAVEAALAAAQDEQGGEAAPPAPATPLPVTDEEIDEWLERLRIERKREEYLFRSWFENCCSEMSFIRLRRIVRRDIESHGWGCIELRRDGYGRLKRLSYVPSYTVRPIVDDGTQVEVSEPDPVTPLSVDREIKVWRRFRIYVQIVNGRRIYFKSPGDPRTVSQASGRAFASLAELQAPPEQGGEGPKASPATELAFLALHSPRTPCPPPRWIGNLLAVLGTREADETNYFYLRDNAIPYGLLFVSGGRVTQQSAQRLEQRLGGELRGARGAGKILIVEAFSGKSTPNAPGTKAELPTIQFESLKDGKEKDALFTQYDTRSADRIGASFRLSPILRGYTPNNLNRATAVAALQFAEQQVFQPAREDFDWIVNRTILPEIGVRFLRFRSNSPPTRGPEEVGQIIRDAAPYGGLVPAEIRALLGDVLNQPLTKLTDDWTQVPMPMTLAGFGAAPVDGGAFPAGDTPPEQPGEVAARLAALEQRMAMIATEELRAAGLDADVRARLVDADAVVTCPICGAWVPAGQSAVCPTCGADLPAVGG